MTTAAPPSPGPRWEPAGLGLGDPSPSVTLARRGGFLAAGLVTEAAGRLVAPEPATAQDTLSLQDFLSFLPAGLLLIAGAVMVMGSFVSELQIRIRPVRYVLLVVGRDGEPCVMVQRGMNPYSGVSICEKDVCARVRAWMRDNRRKVAVWPDSEDIVYQLVCPWGTGRRRFYRTLGRDYRAWRRNQMRRQWAAWRRKVRRKWEEETHRRRTRAEHRRRCEERRRAWARKALEEL